MYKKLKIIPITFIIVSVFIIGVNMVKNNYIPPVEENDETSEVSEVSENYSKEQDDGLLDINTAAYYDLVELPGIGEKTAIKIIEYVVDTGGLESVEELLLIDGIGQSTYEKILPYVKVEKN